MGKKIIENQQNRKSGILQRLSSRIKVVFGTWKVLKDINGPSSELIKTKSEEVFQEKVPSVLFVGPVSAQSRSFTKKGKMKIKSSEQIDDSHGENIQK